MTTIRRTARDLQQSEGYALLRESFFQKNEAIITAITEHVELLLEKIYDDSKTMLLEEQARYELPIPLMTWMDKQLTVFSFIETISPKPYRQMELLYELICVSPVGQLPPFGHLSPLTMIAIAQNYALAYSLVFEQVMEDLDRIQ